MTLHLLRRSFVILLIGLIALASIAWVSTRLIDSLSAGERIAESRARIEQVISILDALEAQSALAQNQARTRSIAAQSANAASAFVQDAIETGFEAAGGQLLNIQTFPSDAQIRLHWLWRGTEDELRAALIAINDALPAAVIEQIQLRRVELDGEALFELNGVLSQNWRTP